MKVEFIWDEDCPNIDRARTHLMRALSKADAPANWQEWDREDPEAPDYVRRYGSPTILVDGQDVGGQREDAHGHCCRVYEDADGQIAGVPSVDTIAEHLADAMHAHEEAGEASGPFGSGL